MTDSRRAGAAGVISAALTLMALAPPAGAAIAADARRAADWVVSNQLPAGNWGFSGFDGEIIAGLETAHRRFGDAAYLAAAEAGASFVLGRDGFDGSAYTKDLPFAAETYALARLAQRDPAAWLTPVDTVFSQARTVFGSIDGYIDATVDFHLNDLRNPIHVAVYVSVPRTGVDEITCRARSSDRAGTGRSG